MCPPILDAAKLRAATLQALRQAEDNSAELLQRERAANEVGGDQLARTQRCDGCHCVSPRSREHFVPRLGHVCVDCVDLWASPSRPREWKVTAAS